MTLPACAVTTRVYRQDGTPDTGARAVATLNRFDVDDQDYGYVGPIEVEAAADADGAIVLKLWPNQRGSTESAYKVRVEGSERTLNMEATVPDVTTIELSAIATVPPYPGRAEGVLGWQNLGQKTLEQVLALNVAIAAGTLVLAPGTALSLSTQDGYNGTPFILLGFGTAATFMPLGAAAGDGSGPVLPTLPGTVTALASAGATTTTQGLNWNAPTTGAGPFTYQVAYRLGSSTGAFTNFGAPVSSLGAAVTGLSPDTAYDYQVTPRNAAGNGPAIVLNDLFTASTSLDSRARFGYGPASPSDLAALIDSMTVFGAANASRAGSFTSAPALGEYVWAAYDAGISAAGVQFSMALGPGDWGGAGAPGPAAVDAVVNTSTVTLTHHGVTWRFFRTNYPNAADTWTTS